MLSDYFEPFVMQDWKSAPDGFGGLTWELSDGAEFMAGITTNSSNEAQIAMQNGMKTIYTIVHPITLTLEKDDRVKRKKDGRLYRITSNSADMTTPGVAQVQYSQVTAEVVEP